MSSCILYEVKKREALDQSDCSIFQIVISSEPSSPIATSVKSSGSSISGFIAVLEFEGNDISPSEARALTNRLRSELVGKGQLTIIERGKMEEILKEQAFQQTGCVSSECAVEVGKMLGVQNIITGSISKVGTIYSVEARVVSVESGEIIKSATYDHYGNIEIDKKATLLMKKSILDTYYIGVSHELCTWAKNLPKDNNQIFHFPNIIRKNIEYDNSVESETERIIIISNFRRQKNIEFAVDLMGTLLQNDDIYFDIYGQPVDQTYLDEIICQINSKNLNNRISIVHNCLNTQAIMKNYKFLYLQR